MELKATLKKPYTKSQRLDFIVTQNHNKGYVIKETKTALEAWGMEISEQQKAENRRRIAQLKKELKDIDLLTIRPLRAKEAGVATQEDLDKLAELEERAELAREQIKQLGE